MIMKNLVVPSSIKRLVTHKDYAVEMLNSIIKETNMDKCGKHTIKDLGAFGRFNLSRVCIRQFYFSIFFISLF